MRVGISKELRIKLINLRINAHPLFIETGRRYSKPNIPLDKRYNAFHVYLFYNVYVYCLHEWITHILRGLFNKEFKFVIWIK